MLLNYSRDEEVFRAEVREFLEGWRDLNSYAVKRDLKRAKQFQRELGARGWLTIALPRQLGGLGAGPVQEYILWDEVAYVRALRPPLGPGIVAKTLYKFGTDAQRAAFLPQIASGEAQFALAYSEPEAGSDLASLRCRARLDGDRYIVNGQKIWNSGAYESDYLWLLCRTGTQESRGRGLTLLVVDVKTPGVEIRPIEVMDGNHFAEIFFTDAMIPIANRIGPENGAWALVGQALADERHVQFVGKRVRRDYEDVLEWAEGERIANDPVVRARLAELQIDVLQSEICALRVLDLMRKGRDAAVEAATNKIIHTQAIQNIARAAMEFGCPSALLAGEPIELLWRTTMWESIGAGTSEIMTGIVARQRLGLGAAKK